MPIKNVHQKVTSRVHINRCKSFWSAFGLLFSVRIIDYRAPAMNPVRRAGDWVQNSSASRDDGLSGGQSKRCYRTRTHKFCQGKLSALFKRIDWPPAQEKADKFSFLNLIKSPSLFVGRIDSDVISERDFAPRLFWSTLPSFSSRRFFLETLLGDFSLNV